MFHSYDISSICVNYLSCLEWNLKYYVHGCYDWDFHYQYNCAPLFKDLIRYVPYFNEELVPKGNQTAIHPFTQLSYVLPKTSLQLLPLHIQFHITEKYPEFYELNYEIQWAFCRYFWESHVAFPTINIQELNKLVIHLNN